MPNTHKRLKGINELRDLVVDQQWPLQKDCPSFYGRPGTHGFTSNLVDVPCPWVLHMDKLTLHSIQIHKKCAASLARVLNVIWNTCGHDQAKIEALRYDRYSGSYNFRAKRGGSSLSMHAYGCAIDWDDADNQFHSSHHLFTDLSPLVVAFKDEGWVWGGDWSPGSVDAMHVQAARIHG